MKSFITSALLVGALSAAANGPQLVVQTVDNGGAVDGQTFRVFVELPSSAHSVHAIYGDSQQPMSIQTTGSFFQHPFGNFSTTDINPNMVNIEPTLAFDSWVTVGAIDATANNLWNVGIDFDGFENGSSISASNGAWFLVPTDLRTLPEQGNLVLIMQLTTTGIASGTLNLQGWDQEGMPWQAHGLSFETSNAFVFGCMNPNSENFSASATYDDGSCVEPTDNEIVSVNEVTSTEQAMVVFPNPVFEGQINLQFGQAVELRESNLIVEIFDGSGKRVVAEELTASSIAPGNRVVLNHDLAAGTYTLNARTATFSSTTQIVVTR
jgi:hypothetical protein